MQLLNRVASAPSSLSGPPAAAAAGGEIEPPYVLVRRSPLVEMALAGVGAGLAPVSAPFAAQRDAWVDATLARATLGNNSLTHTHTHADTHTHRHTHRRTHTPFRSPLFDTPLYRIQK
jgi:hypothetical protein